MTARSYSPQTQCSGKIKHLSWHDAEQAMSAMQKDCAPEELNIYECPHCGLWHVGHVIGYKIKEQPAKFDLGNKGTIAYAGRKKASESFVPPTSIEDGEIRAANLKHDAELLRNKIKGRDTQEVGLGNYLQTEADFKAWIFNAKFALAKIETEMLFVNTWLNQERRRLAEIRRAERADRADRIGNLRARIEAYKKRFDRSEQVLLLCLLNDFIKRQIMAGNIAIDNADDQATIDALQAFLENNLPTMKEIL